MSAERIALRRALADPGVVVMPAAFDGLSALAVARAGFQVVFLTGNGISASLLALPDVGFLNLTDVVNVTANITRSVALPVIVDADTGYGNAVNAHHTVRVLEDAGAAGIMLEDQVNPKRCGLLAGTREVVGFDEAVGKIAAAASARRDPNFVLIGRTDAASALGLDEAIRRANAFLEAGADVGFVEGAWQKSQIEAIVKGVDGPVMVNQDESSVSSQYTVAELASMGVKLAVYPGILRYSVCYAMRWGLEVLKEDGSTKRARDRMVSFAEFNDLVGLNEVKELEERYLPANAQTSRA
jgi:2-methylisocitrate lyase-like PEP mutase family enzyme